MRFLKSDVNYKSSKTRLMYCMQAFTRRCQSDYILSIFIIISFYLCFNLYDNNLFHISIKTCYKTVLILIRQN